MTDHAPLTDEELAEWERQVHGESAEYVTVHLAPKLIAALRASRAEVERLRASLWRAPENWLKGDDEAWFALTGERLGA